MNLLQRLFGKKKNLIVITINDKIQPIDRGRIYEDSLETLLHDNGFGEIAGSGTFILDTGEIEHCNIEILIPGKEINSTILNEIIEHLEKSGAPKGSELLIDSKQEIIEFGELEGIGIYIKNKSILEDREHDLNKIFNELLDLLEDKSIIVRSWEGNEEIGLYYYSVSFNKMKLRSEEYFDKLKLSSSVRYERIA